MAKFFVQDIEVRDLWGHRTFKVSFNDDMNIIIGQNASGKTTLINLLHHALTANLIALGRIEFTSISIHLRAFAGGQVTELQIQQNDEHTRISFDGSVGALPAGPWRSGSEMPDSYFMTSAIRRRFQNEMSAVRDALQSRVPAVWLPVSRRLPIAEEEETERRQLHRKPLESVDECLADLLESLQRYRVSLDSKLSDLRKDFQKHALETILYDKQHDKLPDLHTFSRPHQDLRQINEAKQQLLLDKQQLLQAFTDVGFFDAKINKRVDEHFAAAEDATVRIHAGNSHDGWDIETLFIFPLINRTKTMVQFAQELEQKRSSLFAALRSYEEIVTSFFRDKNVLVTDKGQLTIMPHHTPGEKLDWRHLSSGEKQILILLTQAVLWESEPVIYVADEPELSLHVTWQEKLLSSLSRLAGRCQFIIATHSPDVAGGFPDKIIDLNRI